MTVQCKKCFKAAGFRYTCICVPLRDGETVSQHAVNVSVPGSNPGPAALVGSITFAKPSIAELDMLDALTKTAKRVSGIKEIPIAGGLKYDQEKPPIDLVPTEAVVQIAKVLAFGAKKYDRHNWRKGIAYTRLIAASLRHILAYNGGEDKDPESGLSHIAHALCCLSFLIEFEKTRPELDDRYKGEK